MPEMRAKMIVSGVINNGAGEELTFRAVCKEDGYGEDGLDENNTFSTFTPSADLIMYVNNPALVGKFKEGESYYLDFSKSEA